MLLLGLKDTFPIEHWGETFRLVELDIYRRKFNCQLRDNLRSTRYYFQLQYTSQWTF